MRLKLAAFGSDPFPCAEREIHPRIYITSPALLQGFCGVCPHRFLHVESVRVLRAHIARRPAAGERDCFLIHALCLSLKVPGEFPRLRKTLALTLALPPKSRKIIKNKSQGATPEHRTLQQLNFARCDTTTSHPATLSCRTLRHRDIAPCHFRLSHPATQKARFFTPKIALRIIAPPLRPCIEPPLSAAAAAITTTPSLKPHKQGQPLASHYLAPSTRRTRLVPPFTGKKHLPFPG